MYILCSVVLNENTFEQVWLDLWDEQNNFEH